MTNTLENNYHDLSGTNSDTNESLLPKGRRFGLRGKTGAIGVALFALLASTHAFAEENCFNGPVPVPPQNRGQFTVPQGQAVRLTFNFYAAWENMVFVCDALTGHRILVRGNYGRGGEDFVTPVDNTRSLAYYVVSFHKTVSPDAGDAGSHPWISSPLKKGDPLGVEGQSGGFVVPFGFNDGGGDRFDNSLVTAYFIGHVGQPGRVPIRTVNLVRTRLRAR